MYDDFIQYLKQNKKNFNLKRFETEEMYKAVCFNQFGRSYKYDKKDQPNDYVDLEWEVKQYENRLKQSKY